MGKASEIWKEIKPKVGEMLMAVNDIETQAEKAQEEAYQRGLNDAWEAARKIADIWESGENDKWIVVDDNMPITFASYSASEAIERIRQHEQEQKQEEPKKEQSVTAEEVMRQYLDTFCSKNRCTGCPLHTPDYTCGRGYHFLTRSRISNEEVRRAYAVVLAKMKEES